MDSEERMILRDLPVDTRNYTIIDNITGKPIDQSNYTMTIDQEVIGKLNKLKQMNEEKIKQSALKAQYNDTSLVSTYTPTDNAVFTPVYNDEYINYRDFNMGQESNPTEEAHIQAETELGENAVEDTPVNIGGAEVIQSETLLERVVARDPSERPVEEEIVEEPAPELDYISTFDPNYDTTLEGQEVLNNQEVDNSLFTPEMVGLQQASEQIVKIDQEKLGQDLQRAKEQKKGTEKIKLDKMEIIAGKKIAWTAYILFFIPLLFRRRNRFVRLHANEGLELNIMEILSGLMIAQYFVLPMFVKLTSLWPTISLVVCVIGAGLLGACALTIIPMIICALCGLQVQTPWLWKRRIINVSTERTSDK